MKKNKNHLTQEQRYQIEALLQAKKNQSEIAMILNKDKSVISRELRRNASKRGYSAKQAQEWATIRKERFKYNRTFTPQIEKYVRDKLENEQWSPEQIVGRACKEGIAMVSHERIYQFIRQDKKDGGLLYKQLRHRLKHRKRPVGGSKIVIPDKVSIDLRPEVINNKERFGDWEIDTIVGKENKGAIFTLTERQTGFLIMKKLPKGKNAKGLENEIVDALFPYKDFVFSLTSDNGTEFYEHKNIAHRLKADFFFAHPYSSWERGLNEYTNKLIRQYIPKKQTFENYNENEIKEIQYKINRRPRKKLNFENSKNVFFNFVNRIVAFWYLNLPP